MLASAVIQMISSRLKLCLANSRSHVSVKVDHLRLHLSLVRLQLVPGLCDHVLADRADVVIIDTKVVLLPNAVDAVVGGLLMQRLILTLERPVVYVIKLFLEEI